MQKSELATLIIVAVLIVMDYVSGVGKAIKSKDVDSQVMREGLWHKSAYVGVIALALLLEHGQTYLDLGYTLPVVTPACTYIAVTEIASILENLSALNPELANNKVMQIFRQNVPEQQGKHKADQRSDDES